MFQVRIDYDWLGQIRVGNVRILQECEMLLMVRTRMISISLDVAGFVHCHRVLDEAKAEMQHALRILLFWMIVLFWDQ